MYLFSRHKSSKLFGIAVTLGILFYVWIILVETYNTEDQITDKFQHNFLEQEMLLHHKMPEVLAILSGDKSLYWPKLERLLNQEEIYAQIYQNDSLLFWNNSQIPNWTDYQMQENNTDVILIRTGWYLAENQIDAEFSVHIYKQIKSEYAVNNKYLPIEMYPAFSKYENIELSLDTLNHGRLIRYQNGKAALGLNIPQHSGFSKLSIILLYILYLSIFLFVLLWIDSQYTTLSTHFKKKRLLYLFFVLDVSLLRLVDYFFGFPYILKNSFLFENMNNGLPGFASAGDMILNSLLILFIAIKLFRYNRKSESNLSKDDSVNLSIPILIFLWIFSFVFMYIAFQIVQQIPYATVTGTTLYGFNGLSALFSIVVFAIALFIILLTFSRDLILPRNGIIISLFCTLLFGVFAYLVIDEITFILLISAAFLFLVLLVLFFSKKYSGINTEKYLLFIIIFAISIAFVINRAEDNIRDEHQLKVSNYLSRTNEPELASSYSRIQEEIVLDPVVQQIVSEQGSDQDEKLSKYLKSNYFTGFWTKYEIQFTICDNEELLEIQPENLLVNCTDYFSDLVDDFGEKAADSTLYFVNSDPESIYYIGHLEFAGLDSLSPRQHVYIEFFYTIIPKGLGYPELLVDQEFTGVDLSAYSFARYDRDKLIYKFGAFAYHTNFDYLRNFKEGSFFSLSNYRHFKIEISDDSYLIVSRPKVLITERISTFSILFLIFGFVLLIVFLFYYGQKSSTLFNFNFQTRLQSIFTGSIAFIILLIAIITMYYVENNRVKNLTDQLNEKTYSVLIELQHKLGGDTELENYDEEMLFQLLRKFSLVFFSDINIYNTSGQLIASSRPEIFEKGLLSENINPIAFEELFVDNKLFYLTEEKIGTLEYYSSYVPLRLHEGAPSGIINLPYFARQSEVRQSYDLLLFTFVNLFVILGIIGIFIALVLSRVLTKPLQVLQKKLANIRIDRQNEKIKWRTNDEIGNLIGEYNLMIDKLEQSADMLKQSERESAWREVARQIAHEIKNPLTPMKLNVQYLEKAYFEKDPAFNEKIKSISGSLIEQIDTLNNVAEMFADFSKSTANNLSEVDLLGIIQTAVQLYENSQHVNIKVTTKNEGLKTLGPDNGKSILRVFNNLIKNSIQSLSGLNNGEINIVVETKTPWHIVSISDNGKGIDDNTKNLIFQPYFTTKSGGTGLGLAIVKSIMTSIGGEIAFESEQGKGSTFTLKFRAV